MKKPSAGSISLWAKRLLIYLLGLLLMALGVVFSARSGLGVSPVGSLANVLYQIGLSRARRTGSTWATAPSPSIASIFWRRR